MKMTISTTQANAALVKANGDINKAAILVAKAHGVTTHQSRYALIAALKMGKK